MTRRKNPVPAPPSLAKRLRDAADTLEEASARTGSRHPASMSWTAVDCRIESSMFAAEDHTAALCPACRQTVVSNDRGCIALHDDRIGKVCVASGQPFLTAEVTW